MKWYVFWREIHATPELWHRITIAVVITIVASLGIGSILLVLYCRFGHALHIEIDTQHYLYSSLTQAYATMAGLLLALMGFLHQRIRDRQSSYLEEAVREARNLSRGELPKDLETIRRDVGDWYSDALEGKVTRVDDICNKVEGLLDDPKTAQEKEARRNELRDKRQALSNDVARYRLIASLLTRTKSLEYHFQKTTPASLIMAVGSTLVVVILSITLLASSDHLGDFHSYAVVVTVIVAGLSMWYIGSFIRMMLQVTFGIGSTPDFSALEWGKPDRAEVVIARARRILRE
ncbi:MAG: hypothetical protein KKE24_09365 [Candidatus Thermoplasmatota archaeon]|nr:hypothetical protein [Candidatus Thermoplasmatota archaeon]